MNDLNTKDYETGYENEGDIGPVLPDRLTNIHMKGKDHPTPFAKGTYVHDITEGAIAPNLLNLPENIPESSTIAQYANKEGEDVIVVVAAKAASTPLVVDEEVIQHAIKRDFGDDSDLDYIAREEFAGRREGYVFRLGSKGIGYYTDRYYKPIVATENNLESTDGK